MPYTKDNREILDTTPVEMPLGYEKPESLSDMIARMIKTANIQAAKTGKIETIEEADDFDCDDDEPELVSNYQMSDMQEDQPWQPIPKPTPTPTPTPTSTPPPAQAKAEPPTPKAEAGGAPQ
jgi:hypothetical protein